MNTDFLLKSHEVHIWRMYLPDFMALTESFLPTLHSDEVARAQRFKFAIHQQRFTITRYFLRKILSLYAGIPPEKIEFFYNDHGKPYLKHNPLHIYFNISHSHDMAIYGITLNNEIGIDIEKIEPEFKMNVAKRFFNEAEYQYILSLPENIRHKAFYTIWSRKEALIKVQGKGLFTPLETFSSLETDVALQEQHFYLQELDIHPDYAAAMATTDQATKILNREWLY